MTDELGRGSYRIDVDKTKADASIKGFETGVKKSGDAIEKAVGKQAVGAVGKLDASLQKMTSKGGITGAILGGVGIGAGLGVFGLVTQGLGMVTDFLGDAGKAASDLAETQGKLDIVFRTQAGVIRAWAKDAATSMGMSQQAALEAVGTFGNFLQAMGTTEDAAAGMSEQMVQLAADLGALNNTSAPEALAALRSGLSGEAEPLKRFGVDISDAAVQAELLAQGVQKVAGKFTQAQKIQGRYDIIMRQTTTAQGNFRDTVEDTAGSAKRSAAQIEDMKAKFGPLIDEVINASTKLAGDTAGSLVNAIDAVGKAWGDLQRFLNPAQALIEDQNAAIVEMATNMGLNSEALVGFVQGQRDAKKAAEDNAKALANLDDAMATLRAGLLETVGQVDPLTGLLITVDDVDKAVEDYRKHMLGLAQDEQAVNQATDKQAELFNFAAQAIRDAKAAGVDLAPVLTAVGAGGKNAASGTEQATTEALRLAHAYGPLAPSIKADLSPLAGIVKGSLKAAKTEAQAGMADLLWALNHPLAGDKLMDFYGRQLRRANRALHRAQEEGNLVAIAKAQALVNGIRTKMQELDDATYGLTVQLQIHEAAVSQHDRGQHMGGGGRGARAAGGPVLAGGSYLVGERGPELFMPRHSGTIVPAAQTAQMLASGTIEVVVRDPDGGLARSGISTSGLASQLGSVLREAERTAGTRYLSARGG